MSDRRFLNPKNIIVRLPNWLGDLVMATPILADLRRQWPEAKLTALCQGGVGEAIQKDPHVDQVISFKKPKKIFNRLFPRNEIFSLRTGQYDLGVLLTNSLSSQLLFWQGAVQNRLGYATSWSPFLNHRIPFPLQRESQHLVLTYKMLLEPLGIPISQTAPALYIDEQEQAAVDERLVYYGVKKDQLLIGINPGAAYGSAKCWLPDRFQQVVKKLLENPNATVLFFGDQAGHSLAHEICDPFPAQRVINLAGRTSLRELMAFIKSCHVFLTNDSGPMHVASALGTPLVALFGSTSDVTTGPYRGGKVIHKRVACSPCYRRECPIDFRCMKQIEVEEVYQELVELTRKLETKGL